MELYEVLNKICHRKSGEISKGDKKKYSFMIRRLFSAQFPIQCNLVNALNSDPELATNIICVIATRYNDIPNFLTLKINQKKKKESIFKDYEDEVLNKYMEINEIGLRELEEAYEFNQKEIEKSLKLIKKNFFDDKDKVIVKKISKPKEKKEIELF